MIKLIALLSFFFITVNSICPDTNTQLKKWSTQSLNSQNVVIGKGSFILLDKSVTLNSLIIEEGGSLVVSKQIDITLKAGYIIVYGSFIAGSSTCPHTALFNIILVKPTTLISSLALYGTQVLGVGQGGLLELYGIDVQRTYIPLRSPLKKGDTVLLLAMNPSFWNVDDEIVVASTSFNQHETETFFIKSISGSTVTLDRAATYYHYGTSLVELIDERAEVGILTRNIKIEGDISKTNIGGHCIFLAGFKGIYINNVAFTKLGQLGVLGRYPIHFHLAGDVKDKNKLNSNSVYRCFQRAYAIHGTSAVNLQDNLGYLTNGHMYFLEDGVEERNFIKGNIGLVVNPGTLLLTDKEQPTIFWITNPKNSYIDNIAVGGQHGFWYALVKDVTQEKTLIQFTNNKAHSSNSRCLLIDGSSFNPMENGVRVTTTFDGFVGYKCSDGIWTRGGAIIYKNFMLAHGGGLTLPDDGGGGQILRDSIFIGETLNTPDDLIKDRIGVNYYDGPNGIVNVTFIDFVDKPNGYLAGAISVLKLSRAVFTSTNYMQNVKFKRSKKVFFRNNISDIEKTVAIIDRNGDLCTLKGAYIVKNNPLMYDSRTCVCSDTWLACCCNNRYIRFELESEKTGEITVFRSDIPKTAGLVFDARRQNTGPLEKKAFTLMTGRRYYIDFVGATSKSYKIGFFNGAPQDFVNVAICYPSSAKNFSFLKIAGPPGNFVQATSVGSVDKSDGNSWFFDTKTGYLHLRLITQESRPWEVDRREQPNVLIEIKADFTDNAQKNCINNVSTNEGIPSSTIKPVIVDGNVLEEEEVLIDQQ